MAFNFKPDPIFCLDEKRCIVVRDWAHLEHHENGMVRVIEHGPRCQVTYEGYLPDEPPLWPGALPERLHPWPLMVGE